MQEMHGRQNKGWVQGVLLRPDERLFGMIGAVGRTRIIARGEGMEEGCAHTHAGCTVLWCAMLQCVVVLETAFVSDSTRGCACTRRVNCPCQLLWGV
jgi:hypothetical protein